MRTLAILALLAAVCVAVWVPLGDRLPDTAARIVTPTGEDGRRAADSLALADFGGGRESYANVRAFGQVIRLNFLSPEEIAAYRDGGAAASRVLVASDLPEGKVVVLVVQLSSRDAAIGTAERLTDVHLGAGFERVPDQPRLRRLEIQSGIVERPVGRVFYVHGDLLVRVELNGRPEADLAAPLREVLARQLKVLPADG